MAYAVTQTCCSDAACVAVCPVNCIHPTPEEPDFGTAEMLYVDPQTCIDCGACADACPVDAISPIDTLTGSNAVFVELNRAYYADRGPSTWAPPSYPLSVPNGSGTVRVAVVGSGPAAWYTSEILLREVGAEVTMIERLPVTGGLLRYGVAPDHPSTKLLGTRFVGLMHHPRLHLLTHVEVGVDVTHEELVAHHDAVVYAVGASADKSLGIPGEDLPGSASATSFVAFYNGHPDGAHAFDLSTERVVVIGTGNVGVDVTRLLIRNPEELAGTDIADSALAVLRASKVREVVVLGRRGPDDASWTRSELLALLHLPGVEVVVEDVPGVREAIAAAAPGSRAALLADLPLVATGLPPAGKRVVLRFYATSEEIVGNGAVEGVRVADGDTIATGLVLRSVGYRGRPVPGLPFDEATATVPNTDGRVEPGTYVVGWIKRGPSGGIGSNRSCAATTVEALVADLPLPAPKGSAKDFLRLVKSRKPDALELKGVKAIDRAEVTAGRAQGRPRVKLETVTEMLAVTGRR